MAHHEVVKVAVEDCDQALLEIYGKVKRNLALSKGSRHMVLNFGVDAGSSKISLETLRILVYLTSGETSFINYQSTQTSTKTKRSVVAL